MHGLIRIMTAQMPAYADISLAYCHFAEPLPLSSASLPSSPQVSPPFAQERLLAAAVASQDGAASTNVGQ